MLASGAGAAEMAQDVALAAATTTAGPDITVTGRRDRIETLNSRLGDLRDSPQSISVVPRAVIEQQAATTLRDVLRNVSGISLAAGEGGVPAGDNLTLRGFSARTDIFVDGIRDFGSYTRDTFNVEQVEVVKGPSTAQTGRGSTGGYINLISKQPLRETVIGGTLGAGTHDYLRGTDDINLGEDTTGVTGLAVRLNAVYQDADQPGREIVFQRRKGVAPSVALGLGSETRAILSYFYLEGDGLPDYGVPIIAETVTLPALVPFRGRPAPVRRGNYYGLLARDFENTNVHQATFAIEHDLSDGVTIANTTRYGRARRDSIYSSPRLLNNATLQTRAQAQSRDTTDDILLNQSNLFAEFETGALRHDLIAGIEIAREESRNAGRSIAEGSTTDLFNPDPRRPYIGAILPTGFTARAEADSIAGYLFDTVRLSEQLLVSGGLRYERFEVDYIGLPTTAEPVPTPFARTDNILSWRAGVTWKPLPPLSIYAGAGSSSNPTFEGLTSSTVTTARAALKPEKSRTYEIGAKLDAYRGRLLLTGAVFRIDKTNARTPGLPGEPATVLEGEQRVDGIEFGATGRLAPNWELIGAYTYLDSEIRESNTPAEVGKDLVNTPEHSCSLWSTYRLPCGLELGGGVRYVGSRFSNAANTRQIDDYLLADATLAYTFSERATLRLNVFNLFDEKFYDSISGGHAVPGPARSAVATLAFRL